MAQRVMALALGYVDLNDHEELRTDPLWTILVRERDVLGMQRVRGRDRGRALAGKSTPNRLELGARAGSGDHRYQKITIDPEAVDRFFVDLFVQAHTAPPSQILLDLSTDRTSSSHFAANQLRLRCSTMAYVLVSELRRLGLTGTAWARAQCGTIRLKLLKIGAYIRVSVRRIRIALATDYPYEALFAAIYANLRRAPPPATVRAPRVTSFTRGFFDPIASGLGGAVPEIAPTAPIRGSKSTS